MKLSNNDLNENNNNNNIDQFQKKSFLKRLPFGLKATFIKYWFYGALYFFCYMGLGLVLSNENLIIVTGLIGGVLFDIAVYNIFLLFAETREIASKWWFFKSKKFYSIFINIAIELGISFAFYFITVPIRKATGVNWLFGEPLTSALIFLALDTSIVWLKNLSIILFKKIFKLNKNDPNQEEVYIKIIDVSPVSATIQLNDKNSYLTSKEFNVLLDNEIVLKKINTKVFTLFDLKPDTKYKVTINKKNIYFTTPNISRFYKVYEGQDIQNIIDNATQYSLIVVNKGKYRIKNLTLKNNIVIYFRKGVILESSKNIKDYLTIPEFHKRNQNEVFGIYKGQPSKMIHPLILLDNLDNVKIIAEGLIDCSNITQLFKSSDNKIAPPHSIFINHSSNISIVGFNIKNSINSAINSSYSKNINLFNLTITNDIDKIKSEGISIQSSNEVKLIGNKLTNTIDSISIKSGKISLANLYHIPAKNITVDDCYISNSDYAFLIANENASGIYDINLSNSLFENSKNGISIQTNKNNGMEAIIKNIICSNIKINDVLTPLSANMYHDSKVDKPSNRVLENSIKTPFIDNICFDKLSINNYEYAASYFLGLYEKYIGSIKITNSIFNSKNECTEGAPILTQNIEKCSQKGIIAKNVRTLEIENIKVNCGNNKPIEIENVSEYINK